MKVYFVCTGNTCRSPMAAAILHSKNLNKVEVRSAGIYATDGVPMSMNAQAVLQEMNLSTEHASKHFSQEDAEWADVILTMTNNHKQTIVQLFPEAANKTFTLTEFIDKPQLGDVVDPYGGNVTIYKNTFNQLQQYIDEAIIRMREEL